MKILLAVIYLIIITLTSYAQTTSVDTTVYNLDSVIVQSTRYNQPIGSTPFSIEVIDGDNITTFSNGISIDEIFTNTPGIIVNNRTNLSQGDRILIRGIGTRAQFGVRGIKIILDGIPLTFADGQSQLNNLDIHSIKKVEVIKGPSSILHGNSSGGLISFNSTTDKLETFSINPEIIFGSDGLRKYIINSSGNFLNTQLHLSFNKMNYDGFREHSDTESYNGNLILKKNITSKLKLTGVLNYYNSPYMLNPSSLTKEDAINEPRKVRTYVVSQNSGKKVEQFQSGVNIDYDLSQSSNLTAVVYGISRYLLNPIPGRIIDLDRTAGGFRTQFSTNQLILGNNLNLLTGIDYEFMKDNRVEFENLGRTEDEYTNYSTKDYLNNLNYGEKLLDQQESVDGIGLFIKTDYYLFENFSVSLGGRYDLYNFSVTDNYIEDGVDNSADRDMSNFSSMFGLVYKPNNSTSVFANYSSAFQTPTTNELSNSPGNSGGFNNELNPETIYSYEVGIRGIIFNKIFYNLSLFTMNIEDMLISYQIDEPGSDEIFYKNAGRTNNKGIELQAETEPIDRLNLRLSFSYNDFKYTDYLIEEELNGAVQYFQLEGNEVPGVPRITTSASFAYEFPFNFTASLSINWNDEIFTNDYNGAPPGSELARDLFVNDSYFVANLIFGYSLILDNTILEFNAGINNLFDKRYNGSIVPNAFGERFFEPAPGRNYFVNLSIKI